ncbi:MAG: glycoside hydrolase family 172 protein [Candidatus Limiplasma sp.]|nr:glycoside hydrolase family 172 protein [Candidatus Limiplasma sp.]MEA5145626.1 glycoside hydrolase family 172 protein [Candidatus Limiplasma sp.]
MLEPYSLASLAALRQGRSRAVNAENPTGAKGGGGMASGALGASRKGAPCIPLLRAGETVTLANICGAGSIQHIWCTVTDRTQAGRYVLRDLVLRMYWDGEAEPSVETPLGDFFLNGFGRGYPVNAMPITVNPKRGMNCYLPMPFASEARITVENQHGGDVQGFFYQIDYTELDAPPQGVGRLHAQWRRQRLTALGEDYPILDGVRGKGHYIGTFLALQTLERGWWGEGEIKFYLDGDGQYPTLCGTGAEDYFGGAWSFGGKDAQGNTLEQTFCTPFLGYPFYSRDDDFRNDFFHSECPPMRALYRFHIPDPILFDADIRVTLQQIGANEHGLFERQDDVASLAYWYQTEPHQPFPALPSAADRHPR